MSALSDLTITSDRDSFQREIGRVDSVHFGMEDHGIFTLNLDFDFGATHQGIGHLCVGSPSRDEWDGGVLKLLYEIEKATGRTLLTLKGATVMVLRESNELHAPIVGLQALIGGEPIVFKTVLGFGDPS